MLWLNWKHTFHQYETHPVNLQGASLTKTTNKKWRVESDSSYLWTSLFCTSFACSLWSGSLVVQTIRSWASAQTTTATPVCHRIVLRDKKRKLYLLFYLSYHIVSHHITSHRCQGRKFTRTNQSKHYDRGLLKFSGRVSPGVKAELDRCLRGVNTMKSCLVPPNLKNAGVNAFAKVLNFGELQKTGRNSWRWSLVQHKNVNVLSESERYQFPLCHHNLAYFQSCLCLRSKRRTPGVITKLNIKGTSFNIHGFPKWTNWIKCHKNLSTGFLD